MGIADVGDAGDALRQVPSTAAGHPRTRVGGDNPARWFRREGRSQPTHGAEKAAAAAAAAVVVEVGEVVKAVRTATVAAAKVSMVARGGRE